MKKYRYPSKISKKKLHDPLIYTQKIYWPMQNPFVPTHVYLIHAPLLLLLNFLCKKNVTLPLAIISRFNFLLLLKKSFLKKVERLCSLGDGYWLTWGPWSACSVSCGIGQRKRTRICVPPTFGGKTCYGSDEFGTEKQYASCNKTLFCPGMDLIGNCL